MVHVATAGAGRLYTSECGWVVPEKKKPKFGAVGRNLVQSKIGAAAQRF